MTSEEKELDLLLGYLKLPDKYSMADLVFALAQKVRDIESQLQPSP